jgi:hypothetical protein
MHAKKSLTPSLPLPLDATDKSASALPAAFGNALAAAPQQGDHLLKLKARPAKTDKSARGVKTGVHVTKTEVPRSGHR